MWFYRDRLAVDLCHWHTFSNNKAFWIWLYRLICSWSKNVEWNFISRFRSWAKFYCRSVSLHCPFVFPSFSFHSAHVFDFYFLLPSFQDNDNERITMIWLWRFSPYTWDAVADRENKESCLLLCGTSYPDLFLHSFSVKHAEFVQLQSSVLHLSSYISDTNLCFTSKHCKVQDGLKENVLWAVRFDELCRKWPFWFLQKSASCWRLLKAQWLFSANTWTFDPSVLCLQTCPSSVMSYE